MDRQQQLYFIVKRDETFKKLQKLRGEEKSFFISFLGNIMVLSFVGFVGSLLGLPFIFLFPEIWNEVLFAITFTFILFVIFGTLTASSKGLADEYEEEFEKYSRMIQFYTETDDGEDF